MLSARVKRWASLLPALLIAAHAGAECAPEQATRARIGAQTFKLEVAATPERRAQGLSGRASLGASDGMWFVMPGADLHGFWMRDMRFAIDLVWIDAERRVIDHVTLQPCADRHCPIHQPPRPAAYVLELEAGAFRGAPGAKVELRCDGR